MCYPYEGSKNAGKHLLLEDGMKFTSLDARPDLLQALDSRRFGIIEIARVLNIPAPFLMDLSHATYTNAETSSKWLGQHTAHHPARCFASTA